MPDSKVHFPSLATPLPKGHAFEGKTAMEVMAACKQSEDGSFRNRFVIVGGGTSLNAGLIAEYLIEQIARIPVEVHYASEYHHRKPMLKQGDVLVLVSASGESEDVLRCLRHTKAAPLGGQILTVAIVNNTDSTIAKESDVCIDVKGGTEFAVTSTKVFSSTVLSFALCAIALGEACGSLDAAKQADLLKKAAELPGLVEQVIRNEVQEGECKLWDIACLNVLSQNFVFMGRGFNFPVALEGASKCKETAYIHAEGYPAAEMKHGPIALIDQFMPVVVICPPSDPCYHKIISNLQEVKTRSGCIIAITEEGNEELKKSCDTIVYVPSTHEYFTPVINIIPVQLLAYMMGVLRGNDVTKPRGLLKSFASDLPK